MNKKPDNTYKLGGLKVVQSNDFIEAGYRMDLVTKRMMLCLLAKVDSRKPLPKIIHLDAKEYASITKMDENTAYRDMKKGAKQLIRTIITTYDGNNKIGEECVLADRLKYFDNEGRIECSFSQWAAPYIHYLSKKFTQFALDEAMQFKSFYTIRIYELLMQFKSTGRRNIKMVDLRTILQLGENQYKKFADLRKRIIEPAVSEINSKSSYKIDWKPKKEGRKINSLNFTMIEKNQMELELC